MISIRSVSKSFGKKPVLDGVDLEIGAGRIFGLLGPNGAGKTTLLNILSCQIDPNSGEALLDGLSILKEAPSIRAMIRAGAPGNGPLWKADGGREPGFHGGPARHGGNGPHASGGSPAGKGQAERECRPAGGALFLRHAAGAQYRYGAHPRPANHPAGRAHRGARPGGATRRLGSFQELAAQGRTLLLTTHIMHEAERYCDEVAFLHAGRVLAVGTPEEVGKEVMALTRAASKEAREEGRETLEDVFIELLGKDD